jgi:NinB protein
VTDRFSTPLFQAQQANQALIDAWKWLKPQVLSGLRFDLTIKRETRSTAQNRLMWSVLTDLAEQCEWAVDGSMVKLDPEEVKDVLTAGLKKHQRMCRGIDGGLVFLGQRTSRMTVAEMSDLIELAHAFGAERGVRWSRTSLGRDAPEELFEAA